MFRIANYIILFVILSASSLYGDVKIYLFPKINKIAGPVKLMDIARFEGLPVEFKKLGHIIIDRKIYSDGYIDRRELIKIIKERVDDTIFIYGNAVKISFSRDIIKGHNDYNFKNENYGVKSGDRVRLVVVNRGIRLVVSGTAMEDGSIGDTISVRLKNKKSIRGKIVNVRMLRTEL